MKLKNLKTIYKDSYNELKHLGRKSKKSTRHMIVTINDVAEKNIFEPIMEDHTNLLNKVNTIGLKSFLPSLKSPQEEEVPKRQALTGSSSETVPHMFYSEDNQNSSTTTNYSGATLVPSNSNLCSQRNFIKTNPTIGAKYIRSSTSKNTLVLADRVKRPFIKSDMEDCLLIKLLNGESTGSAKGDLIWSIVFYSTSAFCGVVFLVLLIYCLIMIIQGLILFAS